MTTPEATAKAQVLAIIQDLPDDSSFDEILRELAFHRMIERGLADVHHGRIQGTSDLRRQIKSWRR